jgi:DNA-directed RNA polymerase subunit beta
MFVGNLMPARGSWLELEIDKKGRVYVRIDRKRKLPVTVLLRAMGYATDEEILGLFDNSIYIRNTIDADPEVTKTEDGALIELFKKQRPGEPPSVDNAKALLNQLFFDPKRYDLTRVGRYKLNARLGLDIDLDTRTLTPRDIIELIKELVSLPRELGIPESGMYEGGPEGEEPKNSLCAATTGRMLMIVCGVIVSESSVVRRSRTTRSIR